MQNQINQINKKKPSIIQTSISLHDKNWFQTGGTAQFYCEPTTSHEFQQALFFAHEHNLPIFLLGHGANILISDAGFNGLVIKPRVQSIDMVKKNEKNTYLKCGAGLSMPDLIVYCLNNNIIGLEEFSGIPGTVGGSVYINLHYFEFLLAQFLVSAEIIHKTTGEIETVHADWFAFGYNDTTLHKKDYYLLSATFKLKNASDEQTAFAKGRHTEIIRHRKQRYPNAGTCGSFFRNFHEDEVTKIINGKKMIYVAYYLDKIGVKGELRVGNAMVSHQHANMLVNCGNATTNDIIQLAREMQQLVKKHFNIVPQPECQLVGFENYPLI